MQLSDLKKINIPKPLRNFYVIFVLFFLFWMLFFDANDIISQIKAYKKVKKLEREKTYYTEEVEVVKKERRELLTNEALLERYAREKYLMHKPKEDVFIVVEDKK